jgi:hypothetical protein
MLDYLFAPRWRTSASRERSRSSTRCSATAADDDDERAVRMLAEVRMAQGRHDDAVEIYRDAVQRWPRRTRPQRAGDGALLVGPRRRGERAGPARGAGPRLPSVELVARAKRSPSSTATTRRASYAIAAIARDDANVRAWIASRNAEYYLHRYADALATARRT